MKKHIITLFLIIPFLASCFKDKGNYDYYDHGTISIGGIPKTLELLQTLENITFSPTVTSSTEGKIMEGNPNYTFLYRLGYKGQGFMDATDYDNPKVWLELNPDGNLAIDVPADFDPRMYICWFTVTDNRTGVYESAFCDIKIANQTFEGWMVLCNEGPEERLRLDMISVLSTARAIPCYDLWGGDDAMPNIHHATCIGFYSLNAFAGDKIYLMSKERSYALDNATLKTNESLEFNINFFSLVNMPNETLIYFAPFSVIGDDQYGYTGAGLAVSENGNAYADRKGLGMNLVYQKPINTPVAGGTPLYRVAPAVGVSMVRPANGQTALLYDIDNKRFVGWAMTSTQTLTPLTDPALGKLFSFQTGKDFVYMESTRRSNGLVYTILQDGGGKRSIYAINMGGNGFVQEAIYENPNAPGLDQAEHFAFHSQYPLMFYSVGNTVYAYNLGTNSTKEMTDIALGASEEITILKFNLFLMPDMSQFNNQSEEFMNWQFQLIVGSYDNSVSGVNGGKVGFYEVEGSGTSVTKYSEYTGFAKVTDVLYRERR